jgi:putative sigma-54 modulation protein
MELRVKGKNTEVAESIRSYGERKLGKLERILDDEARIELELAEETNPAIAANQVAEATVWTRRHVVRAREASPDMKASIDQLVGKLERQIKQARDKVRTSRRPRGDGAQQPASVLDLDDVDGTIVRTKQFALKPMSAEEAALQLELLGHDFYVFRSADSDEVNVVYKRVSGGYGLIEPA